MNEEPMSGRDWYLGARVPETRRFFACAGCGHTFRANNTETDAAAEMLQNMGEVIPQDDCASVCDTCYDYFLSWARADGLVMKHVGVGGYPYTKRHASFLLTMRVVKVR